MMKRHRTLKKQHMTCAPKDVDKTLTAATLISQKNTSSDCPASGIHKGTKRSSVQVTRPNIHFMHDL
jgi:hypothetical protein